MALITQVPEPNIWNEICKEFEARRPPFKPRQSSGVKLINYAATQVTPVLFGKMHEKISNMDIAAEEEFNSSTSHPACVGYSFMDQKPPATPEPPPPIPDKKLCPPRDYLESYVFPHLLPAIEAMLIAAKKQKCFDRRRTKFNALDYLVEYLYKNNPNKLDEGRQEMTLFDIPFVQTHLKEHPRPPLPLSLIWTEEEACLVIQSHWRGFMVRRQAEIQELRIWQREWREENANIRSKVDDFWADRIPPNTNEQKDLNDIATTVGNDE